MRFSHFLRRSVAVMLGAGLAAVLAVAGLAAQGLSINGQSATLKATTFTAASIAANFRAIYSTVTLTPATTVTLGTNSVAGLRGETILSAGKTAQDGFFYGVDGRFTGTTGTFNQSSAGRLVGVKGTATLGTMTLTAGQVSGVWADLQGSPTNNANELYPLRVSNSMTINSNALALFIGHATAAAEFSDLGNGSSGDFVINASGTSAGQCAQTGGVVFTKTLKIIADGTTYYIGLCTAP